jgi:hypothetical protein
MVDSARCRRCAKVAVVQLCGNLTLAIHKLIVSILAERALVADAIHSFADVSAVPASWSPRALFAASRHRFPTAWQGRFVAPSSSTCSAVLRQRNRARCDRSMIRSRTHAPRIVTVGALVSSYNYLMYKFTTCAGTATIHPPSSPRVRTHRRDFVDRRLVGILAAMLIHPICDAIGALIVRLVIVGTARSNCVSRRGLMDKACQPRAPS